jgi:hypothetical protein
VSIITDSLSNIGSYEIEIEGALPNGTYSSAMLQVEINNDGCSLTSRTDLLAISSN